MQEVTTKEILLKLGLKSISTIRKWQRLGLIPPPTVRQHPDGRGRIAVWPAEVLDRCLQIRELTRQDVTFDEILRRVGPFKKARRYRFGDAWKQREKELALFRARESLNKTLRGFGKVCQGVTDHDVITQDQFHESLEMLKKGQTPLLVATGWKNIILRTDEIDKYLASLPAGAAVAVLSLRSLLTEIHQSERN